jgi:hypothetical protein
MKTKAKYNKEKIKSVKEDSSNSKQLKSQSQTTSKRKKNNHLKYLACLRNFLNKVIGILFLIW